MKSNTMFEIQTMNQLKRCINALGIKEMNEYEILSFIQTFFFNLPNSIDPLSNDFIPVFPAFKIPEDWREKNCTSAINSCIPLSTADKLKEYNDTNRIAYAIRIYAELQYKLLMNDGDASTIYNNEQIDKNHINIVTSLAHKIINSKILSERLDNLVEADDIIRDITGIWSPFDDLDVFCYQSKKRYNKEIDIFGHLETPKIKLLNNKN